MAKQIKQIYEFGPFHLDMSERVLLKDGAPVAVTPKALETLIVLVEHSGHIVEKEELMKAVWPDAFVEEGSLTRNISVLRKILNNGQEEGQYIETLPRRGYRFSPSVRKLTEGEDEIVVERHAILRITTEEEGVETEPENKLLAKPKSLMRRHPIGLALALIALVAAGTTLYLLAPGNTKPATPRTLAVLSFNYFANDDEVLGHGLTDGLINRLINTGQVVVRPTSAVMKYANQNQDAISIGKELNVELVLDGSLQHVDGILRISLQLVNVGDGATRWATTIDEKPTDIFRLQDKVVAQVMKALSIEPGETAQGRLAKTGTNNIEAYSAYLKGRILWNKRTPEALKQSLTHFNSAIEQDPLYALAYAGLADAYVLLGEYNLRPPDETFPKAKAAAQKALDLDPRLGEAHTVIAYTLANYEWDFVASEAAFRRALELSPYNATGHQWYAEYLSLMERFDEARREIKRAQELDPLSPIVGSVAGLLEYHGRENEASIRQLRSVIELEPNFAPAHAYLALAYEATNRTAEAVDEQLKFLQLSGLSTTGIDSLRQAHQAGGYSGYLMAVLEMMRGLESQSVRISPYDKAVVYAKLGEREQALDWLEKAYDERMRYVAYLNVTPFFDCLRAEPRFQRLLKRIHFQHNGYS